MTDLGLDRCTLMRLIGRPYLDRTGSNADVPGCVWDTIQSACREIDIYEGLFSYDLRWQISFVNDVVVGYHAAVVQLVTICFELQIIDVARGDGAASDDAQERPIA